MRRIPLSPLLLLALLSCGIFYLGYVTQVKPWMDQGLADNPFTGLPQVAVDFSKRVTVPPNRGPEVLDGFRGEVHPLLHRRAEVEVTANWDCKDEGKFFANTPPKEVCGLFQNLNVAIPTKTYTERDFSGFLPAEELSTVGQVWALDLDKAAVFLKQFHPVPCMHLVSKGRRAGPDGAFAVLRAVSPSHLDIVFRIHAEFDLLPKPYAPVSEAWYSPACFLGRLLLNRSAGTVEYFWLGLPTDKAMNVALTVADNYGHEGHDFIHVERMELMGGNPHSVDGIHWVDQMETVQAHNQLARVFYKFKEIDWVAFDVARVTARAQKKPIFAVVTLGVLDDQSC